MTKTLFLLCILLALILALCAFLKWNPGAAGEWMLHFFLLHKLDKNRFRILRNIMLPTDDGATTQIDHIVVCSGGAFVIETKTYGNNGRRNRPGSCWIFGNAADREWTASYPRGRKFRFQNPIRQNYKHIVTLAECLEVPKEIFRSVVAFAGMAKFKTKLPPEVMHVRDVPDYILARANDDVIKPEQVGEVADAILSWQGTLSRERKAAHVANLRKSHPATEPAASIATPPASAAEPPSCPKCGAPMVLRTRKSDGGSFWGCPNFPSCRGIRNA